MSYSKERDLPKTTYDPDSGAAYIKLTRNPVKRQINDRATHVVVDLDADDKIVGVEIYANVPESLKQYPPPEGES